MNIRRIFKAILGAGLALAAAAAFTYPKDPAVQSLWTGIPVGVDALSEEWTGGTLLPVEAAGAEVAFRNDGQYLFMLLIIKDREHLSTLDSTGISVFFGAPGKRSRERGVRFFRMKATAEELIGVLEKRGQSLTEEQKSELRSRQNYILYECEYMAGKKTTLLQPGQAGPNLYPAFKSQADGERTILEFRFPLDREGQDRGLGVKAGETLKVGLEWGGLTAEMKAQRLARTVAAAERGAQSEVQSESHDDSGNSRMSGAGALPGGTGRGTPKKYAFWLDVSLAAGQRP